MFLISFSTFLGTPKSIINIGLFFLKLSAFSIAPFPIKGISAVADATTISLNLSWSCNVSSADETIS